MMDQGRHSTAGGEHVEGIRSRPVYSPPTDIYETKDALVLLVEMPSVDPDGINVTLDKRILTVAGHCSPALPERYTLTHAEYRDGDYERAFNLAENIDAEGIEASLKDGLLKLILPKVKPAPAKTINVRSA